MSFESTALPSELLVSPQPLIGLCGLDINQNSVHKTIWDAFSTNRKSERACVQFKLLPNNYEFPVAKQQRTSYEWYHPRGILKRNWMLKHLHVLPSVIVLFQDLEWNDCQWSEKQLQCVKILKVLKTALQERNSRICLVLLQKTPPLPPGEDMLASERAASLISATGINSKMLFILPYMEHVMGYVLRLESAFLDMAQSYYALMSKRIRTHRDQLTAAHTSLKVRHQFKLGFVAEMRQDFNTALKHYTQSYTTLDEIRINDSNCLEIKTVSGFLNYKICRLMFKLKVARDSINHFNSHIDKYKNRTGSKDLIFEHYAWLSTQHNVFAELFGEAIKNGLPALQTQHPGIYFHKAAEYLQKRKEAFELINGGPATHTHTTNVQTQITSLYSEYFGIRMLPSGEPLTEQQICQIIRENENHYNHSMSIINMLSLAMAQFKIYKCLRFRKKLAIDMADEYYNSGDYGKALTLYSLMLSDYRNDSWCSLFSDVLLKTMRCALQTASIGDFICCSLEALSLKIKCTKSERLIVLQNLWKVLQAEPPIPKHHSTTKLLASWEETLTKVRTPIQVDLDKLIDLIEICASFEKFDIKNDDTIRLNVVLRLLTDVPIKIRRLHMIITDGSSNYKIQLSHYTQYSDIQKLRDFNGGAPINQQLLDQHILLEPSLYHHFIFATEAQQFLENTQLSAVRLEAQIGSDKLTMLMCKNVPDVNNAFRCHNRLRDLSDNITITPMCFIAPTFHLVSHSDIGKGVMLTNEYNPVTLTISNPYNIFMTGIVINISVPNSSKNTVFLATDVAANKQKLHSSINFDVGELAKNNINTVHFLIFSLIATTITLQQKISYVTDVLKTKASTAIIVNDVITSNSTDASPECISPSAKSVNANDKIPNLLSRLPRITPIQLEFLNENSLRKTQDTTLSVKCEPELKLQARFYSLNRKPLSKIYRGENFIFRAVLEVQTAVQLEILETYFICEQNLVQTNHSLKRNYLKKSENIEDLIYLRTNDTTDDWITAREYERNKANGGQQPNIFYYLRHNPKQLSYFDNFTNGRANNTNMKMITINNNDTDATLMSNQNFNKSSLSISDEDNLVSDYTKTVENAETQTPKQPRYTRLVYNKAHDAIQANGHLRGFPRGCVSNSDVGNQVHQQNNQPMFGFYCVKWRRSKGKEENESKFVIAGIPVIEPPLNVYCSIEEKMFVKMPINLKVTLKNSTAKVVHLIATLSISMSDNFICSGHKQLDVTIFAFGEKELVYNLYPLQVGWQSLPELTLVYNMQANPTKENHLDNLLSELVERSIPKKVFVLPPLKQQLR